MLSHREEAFALVFAARLVLAEAIDQNEPVIAVYGTRRRDGGRSRGKPSAPVDTIWWVMELAYRYHKAPFREGERTLGTHGNARTHPSLSPLQTEHRRCIHIQRTHRWQLLPGHEMHPQLPEEAIPRLYRCRRHASVTGNPTRKHASFDVYNTGDKSEEKDVLEENAHKTSCR